MTKPKKFSSKMSPVPRTLATSPPMTDPTSPRTSVMRMLRFWRPGLNSRANAPMTRPATMNPINYGSSSRPSGSSILFRAMARGRGPTRPKTQSAATHSGWWARTVRSFAHRSASEQIALGLVAAAILLGVFYLISVVTPAGFYEVTNVSLTRSRHGRTGQGVRDKNSSQAAWTARFDVEWQGPGLGRQTHPCSYALLDDAGEILIEKNFGLWVGK